MPRRSCRASAVRGRRIERDWQGARLSDPAAFAASTPLPVGGGWRVRGAPPASGRPRGIHPYAADLLLRGAGEAPGRRPEHDREAAYPAWRNPTAGGRRGTIARTPGVGRFREREGWLERSTRYGSRTAGC